MKLTDKRARVNIPSSLFLTRGEFKELYPHLLTSRINYIFKHNVPKEVPDGEAKLLMKKYPHVLRWEPEVDFDETSRHQELKKLKYQDLKKLGSSLGMPFKELSQKTPFLINSIVEKEKAIEKEKAEAKVKKDKE